MTNDSFISPFLSSSHTGIVLCFVPHCNTNTAVLDKIVQASSAALHLGIGLLGGLLSGLHSGLHSSLLSGLYSGLLLELCLGHVLGELRLSVLGLGESSLVLPQTVLLELLEGGSVVLAGRVPAEDRRRVSLLDALSEELMCQ